jgi:paraquat-inducible protein B
MGKQANKTLIGVFVVGAISLLVAAVLVLGGGRLFRKTFKVVMFFEGSIKGLNIGSPVMFRGVKIGSVTDINLILSTKDLSLRIPVVAELDLERWVLTGGERRDPRRLKQLIDRGLRAQLQTQSFVTGQLLIALDFFPDKPARYDGTVKEYPEIPTMPTTLEALSKTLEELPLKEIVTKLELAIDGIQKLVNSPETRESLESLNHTLKNTQKVVQHIDEQVEPLMMSLAKTSETAQETLTQAKSSMSAIEGNIKDLAATTKETLKTTQDALKQAERTLGTYSEDSPASYELNRTLKEMSAAARSLKLLSDYLERHPEALLRGKPKQEGVSK